MDAYIYIDTVGVNGSDTYLFPRLLKAKASPSGLDSLLDRGL